MNYSSVLRDVCIPRISVCERVAFRNLAFQLNYIVGCGGSGARCGSHAHGHFEWRCLEALESYRILIPTVPISSDRLRQKQSGKCYFQMHARRTNHLILRTTFSD